MQVLALLAFVVLSASCASAIQTTTATVTGTWKGACMSMAYRADPNSDVWTCGKKATWDFSVTFTPTTITYTASSLKWPQYVPKMCNPTVSGTYSLKRVGVASKITATYPSGSTAVFAIAKQIGPVRNNVLQYIEDGTRNTTNGQSLPPPNKNGADLWCNASSFNYRCTGLKV